MSLRFQLDRLLDRVDHRIRSLAASATRDPGTHRLRVGWVVSGGLDAHLDFWDLAPPVSMRVRDVALSLNTLSDRILNRIHRRGDANDVVVFFKAMDARCQEEARRIRDSGGRVIFDVNVNYYEATGEFPIPGTRPREDQIRDCQTMTALAHGIVADSRSIAEVASRYHEDVTIITDNVDTTYYRPSTRPPASPPLRLIWSGVAKKGDHLDLIATALARVDGLELTLVSETQPAVMDRLRIPCRFVPFTSWGFRRELGRSHVIISPKVLQNSYAVGHTEYKVTTGMAMGLPAIASPQRSYEEALEGGGGFIARTESDWVDALTLLRDDPKRRRSLGLEARRIVETRFSTPVVAARYGELLERLGPRRLPDAGASPL